MTVSSGSLESGFRLSASAKIRTPAKYLISAVTLALHHLVACMSYSTTDDIIAMFPKKRNKCR